MARQKSWLVALPELALPVLALLMAQPLGAQTTGGAPAHEPQTKAAQTPLDASAQKPPYLAAGDEVEKFYRAYTEKLARAHALLLRLLKAEAPDLYAKTNPAPPKPVAFGYQILPQLTDDPPYNERQDSPRPTSTSYSWPITHRFIENELPRIDTMLEQLDSASRVSAPERRQLYERWSKEYAELESNQQLVDTHIQYNRFWQNAIAEDKPRFVKLTELHDKVLERQRLTDQLAEVRADDQASLSGAPRILDPDKRAEMEARIKQLTTEIRAQNQSMKPPAFVHVTHPRDHVWIARVPVYTDITDAKFLARLKKDIERAWYVEDREDTFKIELALKRFTPPRAPKKGAHFSEQKPGQSDGHDLTAHVAKFPKDGGVITTGANSTYAIPGRYVALGPQPISRNVIAHEFGHILGFVDGYFRGFHDLGDAGFEVIEVVPDPTDIMCTPGLGRAQRYHFEKLIGSQKPARLGLPGSSGRDGS